MAELTRNSLFINLTARLQQDFQNALPPELAKAFVQEAYRELCDERPWYGLLRTGWLVLPSAGTAMVMSFTQLDRRVTVAAATKTYLDALPFLQATRMTVIAPDGRPYHIAAWLSADSVVLLDRPYFGATAAAQPCTILKAYLLAPYEAIPDYIKDTGADPGAAATQGIREDPTFRHYVSIRRIDSSNTQDKLYYQPNPARASIGSSPTTTPFSIHPLGVIGADYPGVSVDGPLFPGMPTFQLYPAYNGSALLVYEARYMSTGGELEETVRNARDGILPQPFTTDLVLSLARVKSSLWCDKNKSSVSELKMTNWLQHSVLDQQRYTRLLEQTIARDNELWVKDGNVDGNSRSQWEALRVPTPSSGPLPGNAYMIDSATVYVGY